MEPSPTRNDTSHPPRPTAIAVPAPTPEETGPSLLGETLPRTPERDRNNGGEEPPSPPEPPTTSPSINATLGRFHMTASAGIGSSIAYIGAALGAGDLVSGVAGLVAYCIAHGRFMVGIEEECSQKVLTETGSVALPPEYLRGAFSAFIPCVFVGLLGYTHPETYATSALIWLFGGTVFFGATHRVEVASDKGSNP